MAPKFKVAVYVPVTHAEEVKRAALNAGAGRIGLYKDVSFTIPGCSEFTPTENASPAIGKPGVPEQVDEVKIEMQITGEELAREVVKVIRETHPYEEVVVDCWALLDF